MKTLILNIDRDNDFGRKAKISSPIIGREENIKAAERLALSDPEDSDVNSIFAAISTYDKLKDSKEGIEIATICGDISVGIKSDQIIARQLEDVIEKTGVSEVILVTDGAEDEYILPIVESRIKIDSIIRVTVKQSKTVEDTYYKILKILDDEKVKRQFLLPIALVLIVWSIFALLNMASGGFGAIILTLGLYLFIHAMHWENRITAMWEDIKSGFMTGRVTIYTYSIAAVVVIASLLYSYNISTNTVTPSIWHFVILFIKNIIWGIVGAGLIAASGRVIDIKVRDKKTPWNYWILPFSLFSFGFIATAIFDSLYDMLYNFSIYSVFLRVSFIVNVFLGIFIAIVGAITYHYIKELFFVEIEEEIAVEK